MRSSQGRYVNECSEVRVCESTGRNVSKCCVKLEAWIGFIILVIVARETERYLLITSPITDLLGCSKIVCISWSDR
ncbi:hypothetical protein L218DRAFT_506604 [Marasmius fiardii PR-910]|nr:hypothetical protein L218DRAFT_506604 [Marasmius fiardii PR-910]